MNRHRHVVAGMIGLALAGCAQDRTVLKERKSNLGTVGLTPAMPSIHDAINLSTETLQAQNTAEEANANVNANVEATPQSAVVEASPQIAPEAVAVPEMIAGSALGVGLQANGQGDAANPPSESVAAQAPSEVPLESEGAATQPAAPTAAVTEPQPGSVAENVGQPDPSPNLTPWPTSTTAATEPQPANADNGEAAAAVAPTSETVADQPQNPQDMVRPERDPLLGANPNIMPEIKLPPDEPLQRQVAGRDRVAEENSAETPIANEPDPLLGANPQLMPNFNNAAKATPEPAATPVTEPVNPAPAANAQADVSNTAEPSPSAEPPASSAGDDSSKSIGLTVVPDSDDSAPAPGLAAPITAPTPTPPPSNNQPAPPPTSSTVDDKTTRASADVPSKPAPEPSPLETPVVPLDAIEGPVELPPLEAIDSDKTSDLPKPGSATILTSSMFVDPRPDPDQGADKTKNPPKIDEAVTGDDPAALLSKLPPRSVFEAGKAMATIGDEIITLRELKFAVAQRKAAIAPGARLSPEESYMLAKGVLNDLVDRALVIQEAKREIKNQKQFKTFMDLADKVWTDEELQPLLRKHHVSNIYQLKERMIEKGETLEQVREQFRQDFLFRAFIDQKLGHKMKVELNDMIEYYNQHLKNYEQPAQITWREVSVEAGRHPDRAAAKKKADAALARLRRGDDFAAVAAEMSEGPNKAKGGFWQTTPGSYNVGAVNKALETLPIGQTSQVIEGESSFHIVKVEARRQAGPQTFAEVQDDIRRNLRNQKVRESSNAYLDKLRKRTLVTTVFDRQEIQQTSAEMVKPNTSPKPMPMR